MPSAIPRRSVLAGTAAVAVTAGPLLGAGAARAAAHAAPAVAAAPVLPNGTSLDKVLVIGMDGLRYDRITAAKAPNLKSLMANGTYGTSLLYASPMAATSSGPGWSTISTGVWPDKHGVKDNAFTGKNYGTYPGFLARLAQVRPQLSTYAAVDWKPLHTEGTVTPGADATLVLDGKPVQERSADPFDTLYPALSGRVDETGIPAGVLGYTRTAPSGWSVINSAMGTGGVTEWRGWSFATDEFWSRSQRDQSRELNVRSRGVFAVADSDEWDDKASSGTYDSTLVTPAYAVGGKAKVRLDFTTLYRQEGSQTAQILASWNGATPVAVTSYTKDVISQPQSLSLTVPAGATSVSFRFRYTGSNNWYWVIDGVRVTAS